MRIIFIHGFGERESIFNKIAPAIGGEQLFPDVWSLVGNEKQQGFNVFDFSKKIVDKYNITAKDWVIGHSMGGWIAYYIKHHAGCRIIQIASWTNLDRIISPIRSGNILYWLTRKRLYLNNFQKGLFVRTYNGLPSKQIFTEIFNNLLTGNKECVINQLKLVFEPAPIIDVLPDLRIHARKDKIIKFPKEFFHEVPGDHFSLITHPETVIKPILEKLIQ
jgi:hypothetical protein